MIKHIVMWRIKEFQTPQGRDNAAEMKRRLESLKATIPEIVHIEVGINTIPAEQAADIVLYSEFADLQALETYQKHPAHLAVAGFVKQVTSERRVTDYLC